MLSPEFASIPEELTVRPQWVAWQYEERGGKTTKVPYNAVSGRRAKSTDPETWATFEQAVAFLKANDWVSGVGFVVTKETGITGVDLDHCRDPQTGDIDEWASRVIRYLDSYTEITPSMAGLRIYVRASLPQGGRKKATNGGKGAIELYDNARYFTVTGEHLEGTPLTIEERQRELAKLHADLFEKKHTKKKEGGEAKKNQKLTDDDIVKKAMSARNGVKFQKLWNGDMSEYGSQSEADLALCSML